MFSRAHTRLVWWPVEIKGHDADGKEVVEPFRLLFQPLTRAELHDRRKQIAERASADSARVARDITARFANAKADDGDPAAQTARLQSIAEDALKAMVASIDSSFAAQEGDVLLLTERTRDWRGVRDEGTEVDAEFSPHALADLLDYEDIYAAVAESYDACCRGAVRKNSPPGPAGKQGQVQA